ncbi:MAG: alkaline phosphatase family protein [Gemmataceae bacterium]|nr:alkaline phosphatase family protein [Gemmataceae bacterium]
MRTEVKPFTKVIVLGLDGLEPRIVERLFQAGELPNLARLRAQGGFGRVATTCPAQTPVAWATFATGTNPGGHGIFDFLSRDPKTHLPDLALNRHEQKNAFLPPRAVNLRRGTPLWELLSAAGVPSTVLRCPCTYPPDPLRGRMLAGMGVPDLRGGLGTATFYTSAHGIKAGESENLVTLPAASGTVATHILGPRNPKTAGSFQADATLQPDPAAGTLRLSCQGQSLELRAGQWSGWLHVKFKTGLFQSVRGQVRFFLVRLSPVLDLYASPVNFDPDAPPFPISTPANYAAELRRTLGDFHTTGMVEDHGGLNNGRIDEDAFLDQCASAWLERERMMLHELERFTEGFFFCLFDTPDRVQHMFWRCGEPDHPANAGANGKAAEYRHVIEDQYRACDAVVGKALAHADERTLFIALSDHGFSSFQRGVHLNTWLCEQGLLKLKPGVRPGEEAGDFFRGVDWAGTKAYSLGLAGIYVNLRGREAHGIVPPAEAEGLKRSIAEGLTGLTDPQRGQVAVRRVQTREEVYAGPYAGESPDLLVHFAEGYRVSWGTALGGVPAGCFEDNRKKWSGDHIIDPSLVPGVLLMNRPFCGDGARLVDLAPTILSALGISPGAAMEGRTLLA